MATGVVLVLRFCWLSGQIVFYNDLHSWDILSTSHTLFRMWLYPVQEQVHSVLNLIMKNSCLVCIDLWWWFDFALDTRERKVQVKLYGQRWDKKRVITCELSWNLWWCILGFVFFHMVKKSRRIHTRGEHLVKHGSCSWLFIRRRGRLCRRWMFLRTTRGTRRTCRFCAVVSWMELLIDFSCTISSRTCLKV